MFKQMIIVLILSCLITSCTAKQRIILKASMQDSNSFLNERYGSGSLSEADSDLAPYYSRINKLYDAGIIDADERDQRKISLKEAYQDYQSGKMSYSEYETIRNDLTQ